MKEVLKFQRPLAGLNAVLTYDKSRKFQAMIPLTKEIDDQVFQGGEINVAYHECEVSGDKIVNIGDAVPYVQF